MVPKRGSLKKERPSSHEKASTPRIASQPADVFSLAYGSVQISLLVPRACPLTVSDLMWGLGGTFPSKAFSGNAALASVAYRESQIGTIRYLLQEWSSTLVIKSTLFLPRMP